jgi:uncharacterized DUF497 family protein
MTGIRESLKQTDGSTVFQDAEALTFDDPDHSGQEPREITIGMSTRDRVLFLSHCDRGGPDSDHKRQKGNFKGKETVCGRPYLEQ